MMMMMIMMMKNDMLCLYFETEERVESTVMMW
jgi:hypothetical protein